MMRAFETEVRARWQVLRPGTPPPSRIQVAKIGLEPYPHPASALLLLAFAGHDAEPVAVAKAARVAGGDAAIDTEAQRLREARQRTDAVPTVVSTGRWNERAFFVSTALPGRAELHHTWGAGAASRCARRLEAALCWPAEYAAGAASRIDTPAWLGAATPEAALEALRTWGGGAELLERLASRLPSLWTRSWEAGPGHGDYFPGNVLFLGDRVSGVVDWLLGAPAMPSFHDILCYELSFVMHAQSLSEARAEAELRAVQALAPFAAVRARFASQDVDLSPGSDARLLVHLANILRGGAECAGRERTRRRWVRLLDLELRLAPAR